MRFIECATLKLKELGGHRIPPYAILSHTWEEQETLFGDDLERINQDTSSNGRTCKIIKTCEVALWDGFHYLWVDTYCIDKGSSAELTEATNSMYKWYQSSGRCYDIAYCLLGIFEINMPLTYGEGAKAFRQLQEEIIQETNDLTLFAWEAEHSTV
ncbi:hypothetical protein B0T21DRAFT_380738 [Apiosordaria backusii]|uniref:Heterokaryon incompatibility domain-containing protein n=1 Tax=Apiosordaria backusii TaxID=314023 RepID=A0AA40ES45_9PEZI|nr:hypothetical protein B0T21DRAFT_380738 [Apiosordaria backusii]